MASGSGSNLGGGLSSFVRSSILACYSVETVEFMAETLSVRVLFVEVLSTGVGSGSGGKGATPVVVTLKSLCVFTTVESPPPHMQHISAAVKSAVSSVVEQ